MGIENPPQLWVIGGPNGSGKSTLVDRYELAERLPVVNPDELAKTLPDHSPIRAGKLAIQEQERLLAGRQSFAMETTLSGKREIDLLRRGKEAGYKVTLVYVGIESPDINRIRIAQRVKMGGHNVPDDDVMRRYSRSIKNLEQALKFADRALVMDNSEKKGLRLVFSQEHGKVKYLSENLPKWACPPLGSYLKDTGHLKAASAVDAIRNRITPRKDDKRTQGSAGNEKRTNEGLNGALAGEEHLYAAKEAERDQQSLIEAAPVEQTYQEALAVYVQGKQDQVGRIEDRLEDLVETQEARLQQIQVKQPGFLARPSTRNAWQNNLLSQKARLATLQTRLDTVREIREGMGLYSPKIEEMATRKLRAENPKLAADWDAMREAARRLQIIEKKQEQDQKKALEREQPRRGRSLNLDNPH